MKKRIQLGITTVLFFLLAFVWLVSLTHDYQQGVQDAAKYEQERGSTAIYDVPLYVNGKDSISHHRSDTDYFLELREEGGRLRRVGVNYEFWENAAQGDTITGEIWEDKVRQVKANGQFQQTATNPHSEVQVFRYALLKWSAISLFMASVLLYSNWYWYKNPESLELESSDLNL